MYCVLWLQESASAPGPRRDEFNIILPSTRVSPKWPLSFMLPHQNRVHFVPAFTCQMPLLSPSIPPWSVHANNILVRSTNREFPRHAVSPAILSNVLVFALENTWFDFRQQQEIFCSSKHQRYLWSPIKFKCNGYRESFCWGQTAWAWSWPLTFL